MLVFLKMLYTYLYMCQSSLKFPFYDSLKTVYFIILNVSFKENLTAFLQE